MISQTKRLRFSGLFPSHISSCYVHFRAWNLQQRVHQTSNRSLSGSSYSRSIFWSSRQFIWPKSWCICESLHRAFIHHHAELKYRLSSELSLLDDFGGLGTCTWTTGFIIHATMMASCQLWAVPRNHSQAGLHCLVWAYFGKMEGCHQFSSRSSICRDHAPGFQNILSS